jgi:hypothetical protein
MKTFKEFAQIDELKTALPKAGSEKKFVQAHLPPEITEPVASGVTTATKEGSGKRKADKLDNKQAFGEGSNFDKTQTKMAHTIGKEFAKKKVGDGTKDAAYAIATSMVKDKPEAAKKAYATIKSKTQNEEHQDALMALFDELNESNQQMFMQKLEQNVDKLIEFATSRHGA